MKRRLSPKNTALGILEALALALALTLTASAQPLLENFETPRALNGDFRLWNDAGGVDAGNDDFIQAEGVGVKGTAGVSVFQSSDTTAVYKARSWNLATNGATVTVAVTFLANGESSGNKIQLGWLNSTTNGLNNNAGVAFESFRLIPAGVGQWTVREQTRTAGAIAETVLGAVNFTPGRWYQFSVAVTNTGGGGFGAGCDLIDYGVDGSTPNSSLLTFPTAQAHVATDITVGAMWPALRAFQDAGIDAWDNFVVYEPTDPPVLAAGPGGVTLAAGSSATLTALAEGPGPITYAWYTNGVLVPGVTGPAYTTPPLTAGYTNAGVVATNPYGSTPLSDGTATLTIIVPAPPTVVTFPASDVLANAATLNGEIVHTGGITPDVILYYGTHDGGLNPAAWQQSVDLGAANGVFSLSLEGLMARTAYFYTVSASNAAGVSWASPSAMFTTPATNPTPVGVAVLTHHNDSFRTGANLAETQLTTAVVNTNTFGLLYTLPVDDQVYAQPLLATNVPTVGYGSRNLLIVATVNDSVYAFDADRALATPLWTNSFVSPNAVAPKNTDMTGACGGNYQDFSGRIGIVGTPVIDPATYTLYVVGRTKEFGNNFVQRLHALDIRTGAEKSNSPVVITATYPGTGDASVNNLITFDSQRQNQRSALALANGVVYIAWSSHCDWSPYHGWIIGYDAATLKQRSVWMDTPNGYQGGIWMSNGGPPIDEFGNIYFSTGNGAVGDGVDPANPINRSESFLKLAPNGAGGMTLLDWFTPYNWQELEDGDLDLACGGIMLIPGRGLIFGGGKQGIAYLVNRDSMGHLSGTGADTNIVQSFPTGNDALHGGPVWWDGPTNSYAYLWPSSGTLQQYRFNPATGAFDLPAAAQSAAVAPAGQPGGILSLSAQGATPGTAVLWAYHQSNGDANQSVRPGTLRAFDAADVGRELWNSTQVPARDSVGNFAKFCPPTVANGKVYLATFSNRINVYGILPPPALSVSQVGGDVVIQWPVSAGQNYQLQSSAGLFPSAWTFVSAPIITTNGWYRAAVPTGATASFYRLKL